MKTNPEKRIEAHLASCLPPGVPPLHRSITNARFVGTGRKRVAVADVVMFDGLTATVEVFQWGTRRFGHRWAAMAGGAAFYEDGRWQRDIVKPETPSQLIAIGQEVTK